MSDVIKVNKRSYSVKVKLEEDGEADVEQLARRTEALKQKQKEEEEKRLLELKEQYDKGFAEGQQTVKAQFEKYYTDKLLQRYEELHSMFSGFEQNLLVYEKSFERLVIETAFIISEKIVQKELERDSNIIEVLKTGLKKVLGANDVVVKLNPADYEKLFDSRNDIIFDDNFDKLRFEKDDRIDVGGCLVETEIGNVDARISTKKAEMRKQLEMKLFQTVDD